MNKRDSRHTKTGRKQDKVFRKTEEIIDSPDFVMGRIPVLEVLKSNHAINKIFLQEHLSGDKISQILNVSKKKGIQVQIVPKSKLDQLSNKAVHQGVIAAIAPYAYAELDDIFELAKDNGEDPFIVILDGIEDPHNLGSIIRTADATGAHGIIIPKRRAVGLTSIVAKTSTGAIEHMPVIRVTNITQAIKSLQERGVWVYATDMEGVEYTQWSAQGPIAIVIGNEGKGVSRLVKNASDGQITIPMVGHVQSLNASVATGILLYEVFRKRRQ